MDLALQLLGRFLVQRPMKRRRKKSTCISPTATLYDHVLKLLFFKQTSVLGFKKIQEKLVAVLSTFFKKILNCAGLKLFFKSGWNIHTNSLNSLKKKGEKKISGDYVKY
jgi:hypothetical protein